MEDESLHAAALRLATKVRKERGTQVAAGLIENLVAKMNVN